VTAQAALKKEAAQFSVEEQLKEREAVEAENAANLARVAENAAAVSSQYFVCCLWITQTTYVGFCLRMEIVGKVLNAPVRVKGWRLRPSASKTG
jgi:hypothetical protein